MPEISFEEIVEEQQFLGLLQTQGEVFFRLANTLLEADSRSWNKKHYFQLINEADALESFLDDFGASNNQTFSHLRDLVGSLRWFAHSGYSLAHHVRRLDAYGTSSNFPRKERDQAHESVAHAGACIGSCGAKLLTRLIAEARDLGLDVPTDTYRERDFSPVVARRQLPRNVGQTELVNEEQRIAEVATNYLRAYDTLAEIGVRKIEDPDTRATFLSEHCAEDQARVYESTVHNLQSMYDTHIANTVLEAEDHRLPRIRGCVSASLHLLEAVTYLTHFIERHETPGRDEGRQGGVSKLVKRDQVQDIILNDLLFWASRYIQSGADTARSLLPSYTNVLSLEVRLPEHVSLHARPVALIVGIVNRFGTPVEMEVGGLVANASSILKMLMLVGSNPEERAFIFRGDERPLRDIRLLFEHGLGEKGLDALPPELDYLRER